VELGPPLHVSWLAGSCPGFAPRSCCRALELALMRVGSFTFAINLLSFASKKNKTKKPQWDFYCTSTRISLQPNPPLSPPSQLPHAGAFTPRPKPVYFKSYCPLPNQCGGHVRSQWVPPIRNHALMGSLGLRTWGKWAAPSASAWAAVGPHHAGGEQTVLTAHAISPGCGSPRSWGEFIKISNLLPVWTG
jgi:hypothetical protein